MPAPLVVVVMGVSGSGKSTLAAALADALGWDLLEGDDLHPPANVAMMARGEPLTDADRQPWLDAIGEWVDVRRAEGRSAVVTCSALRRRYRDILRDVAHSTSWKDRLSFVFRGPGWAYQRHAERALGGLD